MLRNKLFILAVLTIFVTSVSAQEKPKIPVKKIQIVILGTFHFGATGDKNKTNFDDEFAPKRQSEINKVVERLAKYNPDKIFVENEPIKQEKWNKILADYKQGIEPKDNDLKNEIFQIGVKLAKATNNTNGVTCIDYQMPTNFDEALKNAKNDVERNYINRVKAINNAPEPKNSNEKFLFLPFQKSKYFKSLKLAEVSLTDYYSWLNSPEMIAYNHYGNDNYLALAFGENENYVGAEYVDLWYNRNLKIFTNIMRKTSLDDKRYLLIIGAAHVKVLKDFFRDHPYFEIVEAKDILGAENVKISNARSKKSVK
jgi:hypothetical protein